LRPSAATAGRPGLNHRNVKRESSHESRGTRHEGPAITLTIAGSDSSAGAGLQADLKTFSALGVYGINAVTCVVAETPGKVAGIRDMEPEFVREQVALLLAAFPVAAIKTGMLHSAEIIHAVAVELASHTTRRPLPLVVDPVMIATSGDPLLQDEAVAVYEKELFPLAALVTPNLDEAARLLGRRITGPDTMRAAGLALVKKYGVPFLLKGGHLPGGQAIDLLIRDGAVQEFSAPFTRGVRTHGTGCTYSAAITACLARGLSLEASISRSKQFVSATISRHFAWQVGGTTVHALRHFEAEHGNAASMSPNSPQRY
jgi:hydroxymethylpyrimidine/phosphomethylpyrimidine kinase